MVLALTLIVAGCGGGDEKKDETGKGDTKQ